MKKHFGKYNFVILTPETIHNYLPNLNFDFSNLLIAQKVDYYRIALLYKFGGIWMDADTIVLKDLDEIFQKLDEGYDYAGFGCSLNVCFNGKGIPSNGVLASRKDSKLMERCLNKLDNMLKTNDKNKKYDYFDFGKKIIWESMEELKPYDYYHFPSEYDGTRDNKGIWVHSPNFLSEKPTTLINEDKALFIMLANSEFVNHHKWFLELNKEQILNGKWWISYLFRKGLSN